MFMNSGYQHDVAVAVLILTLWRRPHGIIRMAWNA